MAGKLTLAQARVLREARDRQHGATNSGATRRVVDTLEARGLLAFVPEVDLGHGRRGHVWRPTEAGIAALETSQES